jgi:Cu2+-exporting ATPase
MGLATPAAIMVATGRGAELGILFRKGTALEQMAQIDTVVLDKTGTLTLGRPVPAGRLPLSGEALALAAGLAAKSSHPLSRALVAAARVDGVTPVALSDVNEHPGLGLEARHAGETLRLGRPDWAGSGDTADSHLLTLAFRRGEAPATLIPFEDPLRPDAAAAIARLKAGGLGVRILSGDRESAVRHAARALGVDSWAAAQSPDGKLAAIEALTAEGRKVLVVGDGLNDAPMLAAGHASIAPATASDAGQTAADLLFLADSLMAVPQAVETARRADGHVRQNFLLAIGYNILAVPIAMAGLATPLIAAVAMSLSTILVVANALRVRAPE